MDLPEAVGPTMKKTPGITLGCGVLWNGGGSAPVVGLSADAFCAADHEFAAEERAIVQFLNGAFCFFDGGHGDEAESLGALGVVVGYDFCRLNRTNAVEEVEEVALSSIKGEVSHIESWRGDLDGLRAVPLVFCPLFPRWVRGGGGGGGLGGGLAAEEGHDPLPEAGLAGGRSLLVIAAVAGGASGPAIGAAAGGAGILSCHFSVCYCVALGAAPRGIPVAVLAWDGLFSGDVCVSGPFESIR